MCVCARVGWRAPLLWVRAPPKSHPPLFQISVALGPQIVLPFTFLGSPLTLGSSSQGPGLARVTCSGH